MRAASVTLSPPDHGFNGVDRTIREVESVSRQKLLYVDVFSDDTCLLVYLLSGDRPGRLRQALDGQGSVIRSRLQAQRNFHTLYAHVDAGQLLTDVVRTIERHALVYKRPLLFKDEQVAVTLGGAPESLRKALDDMPASVAVTVDRVGDYEPGVHSVLSMLTDRQREALRAAVAAGYYDTPRQLTCAELGAELDCAPSTANDLIRQAERTVMAALWV
jgi:predicted DNA binding protein